MSLPPGVDLCQIPAGAPPAGKTSNFDDPPSLGPVLMSVLGITAAWGAVFTAGRLYINRRQLNWSDYCVTIALGISIATLGIQATQIRIMRHIWDLPACFFDASFARGVYFPALLFQLGAWFAKTSIFLLFFQLFTVQKPVRTAIWIGQAFNSLKYAVGVAVATYYEVPHIGESWMDTLDGRSLVPILWWQLQSALAIAVDLYIFALPLPVLTKLRLPTGRKIALMAVFSLALMGVGASIASLVERIVITSSKDTTWISSVLSLCSGVELNVAIIVSSAPGFSHFARGHMIELPMIQSIISAFSSRGQSRSNLYDPEANSSGTAAAVAQDPTLDRSHRYYELSDTWMLKSGASVGPEAAGENNTVDGATVRTVESEQREAVKKMSTSTTEELGR